MARFDGKNTKQRATTLKITEWSGVTRGAHDGARVTIAKAGKLSPDELIGQALDNEKRDMIEDILENPAYGKTLEERIKHAKELLAATKTSKISAKDYAYVPDPEKPSTWKLPIDTPARVSAAAQALSPEGYRGNTVEIPESDLAEVKRKVREAYKKAYPDKDLPQSLRKQSMTFEEWLKENPGKTEEDFKAEFKKFRALAEMNDLQKSHFNSLTTDVEKAAFIAMSSDERNTTVEMIKSMDETFTNDAGVTIAKSAVGSELFTMLKTQNDEIVKMRNEQVMLKYTGEANSDSRMHLPGDEIAKAKALQYIDAAPEEIRKTIGEMLNAGNGAMKESLTVKASAGGENHTPTVALQKMNAMVQKHMTDHNVTKFAAMEALAKNAEYCALEEEARGEA